MRYFFMSYFPYCWLKQNILLCWNYCVLTIFLNPFNLYLWAQNLVESYQRLKKKKGTHCLPAWLSVSNGHHWSPSAAWLLIANPQGLRQMWRSNFVYAQHIMTIKPCFFFFFFPSTTHTNLLLQRWLREHSSTHCERRAASFPASSEAFCSCCSRASPVKNLKATQEMMKTKQAPTSVLHIDLNSIQPVGQPGRASHVWLD